MLPENHCMLQVGQVAEEKLSSVLEKLEGKQAQVVTESRSVKVQVGDVVFRNPGSSGVEIITSEWMMNEKMEFFFLNSDGSLNNFESTIISEFFKLLKEVLGISDKVEFTQNSIRRIEVPFPAYASE